MFTEEDKVAQFELTHLKKSVVVVCPVLVHFRAKNILCELFMVLVQISFSMLMVLCVKKKLETYE